MKKMSGVKCSLGVIVAGLLVLLLVYFFSNEQTAELLSCLKVIVFEFKSEAIILLAIVLILAVILFLTGYVFGSKFNKTETKDKKDESTAHKKKQTSYASHASKTNQTKNNSTGRP